MSTASIRLHSSDDMAGLSEFAGSAVPVAVAIRPDGSVDVYGYVGIIDQRPEPGDFDPDAYPLDLPEDAPDYWASYDAYWATRCTAEHPCPVRAMQGGGSCGH